MESFRLLTEYHSFLFIIDEGEHLKANVIEFPSPYGVSFILILKHRIVWEQHHKKFPSPCGVSFILIKGFMKFDDLWDYRFRLLAEYHSFLCIRILLYEKGTIRVSVSLRSIIHSYKIEYEDITTSKILSFRLLTEYHSFL